jgi:ankyrin repeat protein
LLLDSGANVDAQDDTNMTALHSAVRSGHETISRLLLDAGANIDAQTFPEQMSALHLAVTSRSYMGKLSACIDIAA